MIKINNNLKKEKEKQHENIINNKLEIQSSESLIKDPLLFILNKNTKKRIYNIDKIYKNTNFYKNYFNEKNIIIEILNINEFNSYDMKFKIHLICKKEVNECEYNDRDKLLIKFNSLFKKFLKKKFNKNDLKDKHIYYTDLSYIHDNKYMIFFYIIVSHEVGVFKNINNIKNLVIEFNNTLKIQKNNISFKNFIDLNVYNKEYFKNVFTYINNQSCLISIYNGNINKSRNIYNKYYFMNSLIGYYGNTPTLYIMDDNIKTLDEFFNKNKIININ